MLTYLYHTLILKRLYLHAAHHKIYHIENAIANEAFHETSSRAR